MNLELFLFTKRKSWKTKFIYWKILNSEPSDEIFTKTFYLRIQNSFGVSHFQQSQKPPRQCKSLKNSNYVNSLTLKFPKMVTLLHRRTSLGWRGTMCKPIDIVVARTESWSKVNIFGRQCFVYTKVLDIFPMTICYSTNYMRNILLNPIETEKPYFFSLLQTWIVHIWNREGIIDPHLQLILYRMWYVLNFQLNIRPQIP